MFLATVIDKNLFFLSGYYSVIYKYTMMYRSNTTKPYYVYYLLRQRVSILIESSSGPSKIQILT